MDRKKLAFALVMCGLTLDNLSVSAGFTMTDSLEEKLHEDYATVSWVISSYSLTMGAFVILTGKLGDIVGLHVVYITGLVVMGVTGLIVALVPKAIPLIIFRAIQGIGGAALVPTSFALTASYFQGKEMASAFRYLVLSRTASFGLGTILGGAFSETSIGYKSYFYFHFAVSVACLAGLTFFVVKVPPHKVVKLRDLDYAGSIFLVAGLLLIILGFTEAGTRWDSPKVYVTIPVGVIVVVGVAIYELVIIERLKAKWPDGAFGRMAVMFPSELGTVELYIASCVSGLFVYCAYATTILSLLQFHMDDGDSPLIASLRVFPSSVGIILCGLAWRPHYTKGMDPRLVVVISTLICLGMSIWTWRFRDGEYWRYELVSLFIQGFSLSVFFQTTFLIMLQKVPMHLQANANGIFQTFGQVGISLGSAVIVSIIGQDASKLVTNVKRCFYLAFASYAAVIVMFAIDIAWDFWRGKTELKQEPKAETEV
ncbi:hypothetical protein OGAPHI_004663 [Ogataea philodendri]|uniref:Major facilitator superfamily (MFS) profile domain-containing protein n=1 Tax=Ogataea philodendri TaxID=1378263 RepID=A0A9P8T392_9ASCO|nr:uncharacterized protein OGAPHI_004663 [Ogataea philodendri]KAH3663949.1 hypothetical protein OGAPHI_004663 [Ogataea philodendri]